MALIELRPETALAFDAYVREAEAAMEKTLYRDRSFLWSDGSPERVRRRDKREIAAQLWAGNDPVRAPHGLIHDWIGAVSVAGATIESTLALLQDYDHHKNVYQGDVLDSKLLSRLDDDFKIYLRLLKRKVITVVLDTYHEVRYSRLSPSLGYCSSRTTRIAEVEDAGTSHEKVLPAATGHGFLWRLHSYWRWQERDRGTVIECRAISLTRDIPMALKLIVQPMVRSLPKESLVNTLAATRRALELKA